MLWNKQKSSIISQQGWFCLTHVSLYLFALPPHTSGDRVYTLVNMNKVNICHVKRVLSEYTDSYSTTGQTSLHKQITQKYEMIDNEQKEFMFCEEEGQIRYVQGKNRPLGVYKINSKNVTKAELEQMFQWSRINKALFLFYPQFFFHLL